MIRLVRFLLLGAILAAVSPAASAGVSVFNLFYNGDFEDSELGIFPSYTDRNFQPGLGSWISTSDRSAIVPGNYDPGRASAFAAGDAELRQDFYSFASDITDVAGDISAAGGATFGNQITHVSFWAAHPDPINPQNPNNRATEIFVSFFYNDEGQPEEHTYNTVGLGWEFFDVTGQYNPDRGELIGLSIFGNISGSTYLDDIQVLALIPVPEPASAALVLASATGLLFVRRRRR